MVQFKKINIDSILESLTRICWKNNIQYRILFKTKNTLIMELAGNKQIVLFKYQRADVVSRQEVDFFMSCMDESRANKGVYITTGIFEKRSSMSYRKTTAKKDIILEDSYIFTKSHIGIAGDGEKNLKLDRLNLVKYLPH
jgi:hypothetical protein